MKANLNLKTLVLLLTMGTCTVLINSSCKDNDDPLPAKKGAITEIIAASPAFSVLKDAVLKAGLDGTLKGAGPFTVFAPDNAAFTASGITSLAGFSADSIKRILLYHTLASKKLAADLPAGPNAKLTTATTDGDSIFVTKKSGTVFINGILVTTADFPADNGVIHTINRVLIPASGNLVATVIKATGGDNGLDSLLKAVVRADAAAPGLITLLNSNLLTVFAPTNKAFRDLLTALGKPNIDQIDIALLNKVLQYHVFAGRAFSSDLSAGQELTMFGTTGKTVIALPTTGPTIKGASNTTASKIIGANIVTRKGVVHLIDQVLRPLP